MNFLAFDATLTINWNLISSNLNLLKWRRTTNSRKSITSADGMSSSQHINLHRVFLIRPRVLLYAQNVTSTYWTPQLAVTVWIPWNVHVWQASEFTLWFGDDLFWSAVGRCNDRNKGRSAAKTNSKTTYKTSPNLLDWSLQLSHIVQWTFSPLLRNERLPRTSWGTTWSTAPSSDFYRNPA